MRNVGVPGVLLACFNGRHYFWSLPFVLDPMGCVFIVDNGRGRLLEGRRELDGVGCERVAAVL